MGESQPARRAAAVNRAMAAVDAVVPSPIDTAEFADPTLLLSGVGWSMSATCSWRWVDSAGAVVSPANGDAADRVWDLVGEEIVSVSWSGPRELGVDPIFGLRSGGELSVFSDAAFDAWVMHTPDLVVVGPL